MTSYVVTAPLVQVTTEPKGVAVQVMKGGPVPTNISKEALANLIDLGYVEEAPAAASAPTNGSTGASTDVFDESTLGTANVADTMKWVGKDKDRAEKALAAEQAKPEADVRGSLVAKLRAVIAGGGS